MKGATACALVVLGALSYTVATATCLHYDGDPVVLKGVVISRTSYGPPGFGEDPVHDDHETQALLRLDAPLCVDATAAGAETPYDRAENQVEITLVPMPHQSLKSYVGRRVTVTGTLFGAHTGHHHTDVLMEIRHIVSR
jgi:hypothetical protein